MTQTVAGMEPFMQAGSKLLEAWMTVGTEILEFSKAQLDHSIEVGKAMAKSGNLNEAMELQAKFSRTLVQDYIAEANKIADLSTRNLLDSFSQIQQATQEATQQATRAASVPLSRTAAE
jgi:hypothetical protein